MKSKKIFSDVENNRNRILWPSLAITHLLQENLGTVLALGRETSPGYYGSDFKPGDLEHVYSVYEVP